MQRKVIISCAVSGSADTPGRNSAVPVTPEQIARSSIDAAKAGAAIVHIHVRNPQTTKPSMDAALYREVVERIRASGTDVLINLTTGPGARFSHDDNDPTKPGPDSVLRSPEDRVRHVVGLKPDICSLDMGSLNMGDRVFVNTPKHLQAMAAAITAAGVMPELEVFETGHLLLAKRFIENGFVKPPGMFQICLGISWGQPATPEAMTYMRNLLPPDSPWFAFGISLHQFPMVAQTVLLGGHPRVGLEDNIYLEKGKMAPSKRRWSRRRPGSSRCWVTTSRRGTMRGRFSDWPDIKSSANAECCGARVCLWPLADAPTVRLHARYRRHSCRAGS
jgi:3-dehydrocarnitine:acetyl-CoA trimethylamine transferase